MSRKRCFHCQLADIIIAFQDYTVKTRAISKAGINPREFTRFLDILLKGSLVEAKGRKYRVTEKGRDYIAKYFELEEMLIG